MTNYRRGQWGQWKVRDHLTENGYRCVVAAGSKGKADLVALKPGQVLLVQVKIQPGPIPPAERRGLVELAEYVRGLPIAASAVPRKPIAYRRLTGIGPNDFEPWTPDELEAS